MQHFEQMNRMANEKINGIGGLYSAQRIPHPEFSTSDMAGYHMPPQCDISPLNQALREIHEATEGLNSVMWRLASKLEPIRLQRPQADQAKMRGEAVGGSEVVVALRARTQQLHALIGVVEMLIQDCEV